MKLNTHRAIILVYFLLSQSKWSPGIFSSCGWVIRFPQTPHLDREYSNVKSKPPGRGVTSCFSGLSGDSRRVSNMAGFWSLVKVKDQYIRINYTLSCLFLCSDSKHQCFLLHHIYGRTGAPCSRILTQLWLVWGFSLQSVGSAATCWTMFVYDCCHGNWLSL